MPLKLEIKKKLTALSDRVKCVDLHPVEPWILTSLYDGTVHIWNHESQAAIKTIEICNLPVRVARFIPRKNWLVTGSDDLQINVFNYNTLENVIKFEAHSDYIRSIIVHPTQPYILTSGDDMTIKLWNWEKLFFCGQVFQSHTHYIMQIVLNPKDNNTFASASLDQTLKVWQLGSSSPNFTLEGHTKGVNCVDYCHAGDKPYLISGADDKLIKIWDYQNKSCIQTLSGHTQNISSVVFHPKLPIVLTGSEDGSLRMWHSSTYRLENVFNSSLERIWSISCLKGSNHVAIGYDEGTVVIQLGHDDPVISMDSSGRVIWAKGSEISQVNLKAQSEEKGESVANIIKDLGSCDIYPQSISHSPNGRFVVVCGDEEYIIYTARALRNKSFGSALDFVWCDDSSLYAIRESTTSIKIFQNFKEKMSFQPDFEAEAIFGGFMIGVKSKVGLSFYSWLNAGLVRRIDIDSPKHIYWSTSNRLLCVCVPDSFYILIYNEDAVLTAMKSKTNISEDGVEDAFQLEKMHAESVTAGMWVGDIFVYINAANRLNYYVGGDVITIAHLDRPMYLLNFVDSENKLYLSDKAMKIEFYHLPLNVMEYQAAIMRGDLEFAQKCLPSIPNDQLTKVAHFLEKLGFKSQALKITTDLDHKFDLAIQLMEIDMAYGLAKEAMCEQKWKRLSELATKKCDFELALECSQHARDYAGSLMLATSSGNRDMLEKIGEAARKECVYNVAFTSFLLMGNTEKALDVLIQTGRLPEAAFFANTYLPSRVSRIVKLWKIRLCEINKKASQALADPEEYENLFPNMKLSLIEESNLNQNNNVQAATSYQKLTAH